MSSIVARLSGLLHALRTRATAILHGRRLDRELDEEMRFHLEQQTRKNRLAGMSEADARRAAERAFGSVPGVRDRHRDARGVRFLDDLRQDVVYGLRRLRSRPWITLAAVGTLALGVGAVTTIYSAMHALLVAPVPFPGLDRLVVLGLTTRGELQGGEGWADAADVRAWQQLQAFDGVAPLAPWFVPMVGAGEPVDVIGYRTTPELFRILGVDAARGRLPARGAAGSPGPEVVLADRFWRTQLGADPAVLGRSVHIDGTEMTIVGVLPPGAEYPMGTDLWGPLELSAASLSSHGGPDLASLRSVARLAPGATLARARAALQASAARLAQEYPDSHGDRGAGAMYLLDTITYGTRPLLVFLMGGAGCLLLLVCANVAHLQLMSGTTRRQEVALRTALGAGRPRIVRQLLTESLCLGLLGAAGGALLAFWGGRLVRASLTGDWWRFFFIGVERIGVDVPVLAFALLASLAATVVFGLLPALRGSRVDLAEALKTGGNHGGGRRGISRAALVVVEVTLSVVLVWGALLMVQAMGSLSSLDLGFDQDVSVLQLRPRGRDAGDPAALESLLNRSLDRVAALPGVASAALADHVPGMGIRSRTEVSLPPPGPGADDTEQVRTALVTAGYFDTLGVGLVAGDGFADVPADGQPVAVVSESLARRMRADGQVVGSELRLAAGEITLTVVGVVADVDGAYNDPRPRAVLYRPASQLPPRPMQLLLRPGAGGFDPALVRGRIWEIDPDLPLQAPRTVAELVAERAAPLRMVTELMGGFAVLALLLCLGGVHAVVSYAASLRTREVGVRMALGARREAVARLFGFQGARLCAMGIVLGVPLAYVGGSLLARGLARFLPTRGLVDPLALGGLALVLLLAGAVAGWLPGRRAARVDPATTLRSE